jgi:hypothetical protein
MKRPSKRDPLARILAAARKDPEFFHELVFAPRKAIAKATFLDRKTRDRLLGTRAGTVIAGLVFGDCGNAETCSGKTCGRTCVDTCNGATCGGGSCQDTCTNSCPDTITPPMPGPAIAQLEAVRWKAVRTRVSTRVRG